MVDPLADGPASLDRVRDIRDYNLISWVNLVPILKARRLI